MGSMIRVLVTGARGFIGQNLVVALRRREDVELLTFDIEDPERRLDEALGDADFIFHLAGVNRPPTVEEFGIVNAGLTRHVVDKLSARPPRPTIVLTSSTQAVLDNPYGSSKLQAESVLREYVERDGGGARVFRLPNVFGKWCRPNYNSVVATFCHNIAHGLPITISDPAKEIQLVYIDDVVRTFVSLLDSKREPAFSFGEILPVFSVTLQALADTILRFKDFRTTLIAPDFSDPFVKRLYPTFLSYLETTDFAYSLTQRSDDRGTLSELLKSNQFGQIFVSRTRPGITRGNHFHDSKIEKFCVLEGEAVVRFRHIVTDELVAYQVKGTDLKVIDIPPGYTHSIENSGLTDLITLFWADEIFNPEKPDTYSMKVIR
jgi:UDP-2-acetamido-2,6-beta-L-arabino-hexul-4-ose reductase